MAQPLAGKTSTLGQFTDEVVEQAKPLVEPKKILEQILGKPASDDSSIETDPGQQASDDPAAQALKQQQQNLHIKKQVEDQQRSAKMSHLLLQRIHDEEEKSVEKNKQEEEQKVLMEEEDKKQKNQQIVQLQHEAEKDQTLSAAEEQLLGTKEKKAWGAG